MTNAQRATLAEIAKRMGRRALEQVASVAKPETILAWYRKLTASKFDDSKHRAYPGRATVSREIAELVVRMARENRGWGYDRIAGALKNLGHNISDQTVGNILRWFEIVPARKLRQQTTWAEFIRSHLVTLAGVTQHPTEEWMAQMARNAVDEVDGALLRTRFALHDRDTKFCTSFQTMLKSSGVQPILLRRAVRI